VKKARLIAPTVEILCPHCDAPQPAPDNGSHMWLSQQLDAAVGARECVECGKTYALSARVRIVVG